MIRWQMMLRSGGRRMSRQLSKLQGIGLVSMRRPDLNQEWRYRVCIQVWRYDVHEIMA